MEGVEGSGKTTQAALLCDYLRRHEIEVRETREPGGTALGETIREILLCPTTSPLIPVSELLLFLSARAQQIDEVIAPALEKGEWVVCDRYCDATLAYQGYGRGLDLEKIQELNHIATGGLKPDMTILLDLHVETGLERAVAAKREFAEGGNGDRMERENREFHKRVREGYLHLARQEPDRIKVIRVTGSIEEVHRTVVSLVEPFLVKAP